MKQFALLVHAIMVIFGLIITIFEYKSKINKKLSIFMGVNLVFVFIYGIVPIILMTNNFFIGKTDFYLIYTVDQANEQYLFAIGIIFIGYLSMLIGYFSEKTSKKTPVNIEVPEVSLKIFGFLSLIVSSFSTIYTASTLGGIVNSLKYIVQLRVGQVRITSPVFLLLPLSITSFLIYLSLQIRKKSILSLEFLFLVVSFLNSIYYVLIFGGRLPLTLFMLIIPLYYLDKNNKVNIKNILLITVIGVILLNYLEDFFKLISQLDYNTKNVFNNIPRLIAQFSFPYINSLKVRKFTYNRGEFRYFVDFISWIVSYIPKKFSDMLGIEQIMPSYLLNSKNHLTKGIPTDIISFGYYQFALPGVIVVTFLFGKFIAYLDKIFDRTNLNTFMNLAKIRLFEILSFYPMYADIEAFMRRRVDVVLIIIILFLFSRKEKNNKAISNITS